MVTPTDPVVCAGDPVQLTASGTGVTDFTWTPPLGLSCTDCPNPIATVSTTSTFTVTGEVQGCPTGGAVTVTIAPSPTYQFPSDQSLCLGESVTLNEAPANFTYNWTSSNNTLNTTDDSPSVTPSQTTTYYLTISNGSCDRTDSVTIVVNSQSLNLSEDITLCIGNSAVLTGTTTGSGNYQWSTGETTSSITVSPTQNTTYDVVYTYGDGCTLQGQVVVSVADNFAIDLAATPDVTEVVQGDDIQLDVSVTGTATNPSYAWTENGTALAATSATVTVTPIVNPTTYAVTVTSQEGCSNTAEIVFAVLEPEWEIPNAFSPNGDEINDVFKVVFKNENNIQTLRFQVFNRWGQKVYDWTTGEPGWDGKLNGNDQPAEVYLYYIELQLGTGEVVEEKGDLTLIR
jgi:gliding motility-associated-like protein